MTTTTLSNRKKWLWLAALSILAVVVAAAALLGARRLAGEAFGLRESARIALGTGMAVLQRGDVLAGTRGEYTNVFFLHHSVGMNLVDQGNLRELFQQAGVDFWDQGYRYDGMRGPDGQDTGFWYPVPNDNTDPDGLARVLAQQPRGLPVNALSGLLQHEVIILKSCYPNSSIADAAQMDALKALYVRMRNTMDRHPDRLFILLTTPPLNPAETRLENARYAREMSEWLLSEEFQGGRANLRVFDFYSLLAENDPASPEYGMLRATYRDGADSHPNAAANRAVAPQFAQFVLDAIDGYRGE